MSHLWKNEYNGMIIEKSAKRIQIPGKFAEFIFAQIQSNSHAPFSYETMKPSFPVTS